VAGSLSFAETNPSGAARVAQAVNDPSSPYYHEYLRGAQYDDLFGPNASQQQALILYLGSHGVSVTVVSPFLWNVRGTAAAMDAAFGTTFVNAAGPNGVSRYAPVTPLELPSDLASGVSATGAFQNAVTSVHPDNLLSKFGDRLRDHQLAAQVPAARAGTIGVNITNKFIYYTGNVSSPTLLYAPTGMNETYTLNITGGTPPYLINWNWGDGTVENLQTDSASIGLFHNFPFPGQTDYCFATFTVACLNITVTVNDTVGDTGSVTLPVVPAASPITDELFYNTVTLYKLGDTGQGVSIGLDEMCDPYYSTADYITDINTFSAAFGLPQLVNGTTLQLVGSGDSDANCGNNGGGSPFWAGETLLDMEWSHSMAPNATLVVDLSASAIQEGDSLWDSLSNGVFVDSNSWGCPYANNSTGCGYSWTPWEQAAAQGQSYLTASGDCGAAGMNGTDPPTDTSFGVGVGGTDIYPYASGVFRAEYAWNGTVDPTGCENDEGSTGGYASNWAGFNTSAIPAPWYQTGTPGFVNPYRGVPDVSAIGGTWVDQFMASYGGWFCDAGTSLASPTWAGMLAVIYEYNKTASSPNGFANKDLYNLAKGPNYDTGMHDIVVGNNIVNGGAGNSGPCAMCYNDTPGWDAVTGLGSADVGKLAMLVAAANGNPQAIGPLTAVLAANVTFGPAELSVNFGADVTGGPAALSGYSYQWTFGDGGTANTAAYHTNYTYDTPGIYDATVTVTSGTYSGTSNTVIVHVTAARSLAGLLTSVSVSPASATMSVNGTQAFTATPTCSPGACSPGVVYAWSVSPALGTLNSTTGNIVQFTAGASAGWTQLFLNATLNGVVRESVPVLITIAVPVTLTSITVSPVTATIGVNTHRAFTTTITCTSSPCPSGTTYTWSMTQSFGSFNSTLTPTVTFTAGPTAGTTSLFVNATLNGKTLRSSPVTVDIIPVLASVTVTPAQQGLSTGASSAFAAQPSCNGGACPAGTTFSWSMSNGNMGTLNSTTAPSVTFTAGGSAGTVDLFVNATLNGVTIMSAPVVITVTASSSSSGIGSGTVILILVAVIAVVVVAVVLVLVLRRRKSKPQPQYDQNTSPYQNPPPPSQQAPPGSY
jgi:subtilase family serine protease